MNICKESYKSFKVVFILFNKRGKLFHVGTKKGKYELPRFFLKTEHPPYCFIGPDLRVALLRNMVEPTVYRSCVLKVEICECDYCSQCDLVRNSRQEDNSMLIHRKLEYRESQNIRLYYYWEHTRRSNKEVNKQIKFEIVQGHCDQFFDDQVIEHEDIDETSGREHQDENVGFEEVIEHEVHDEGSGREQLEENVDIEEEKHDLDHVTHQNTTNDNETKEPNTIVDKTKVNKREQSREGDDNGSRQTLLLSSVIFAVILLFLFIVLVLGFVHHKKVKIVKKREEIDQNPDYGYDNEGVEYHESAIKDTNLYYGEDSDDDDLDNVVQDANPYYEVSEY